MSILNSTPPIRATMPVPLGRTIAPSPSSQQQQQPPMEDPLDQFKPYPASTTSTSAIISNIPTTVTRISFSDRILLTIVQEGRLAQWLQVPLDTSNPTSGDPYFDAARTTMSAQFEDGLLPSSEFTPKSLLGAAGGTDREVLGQLYASQVASAIKQKDSGESRTLVLGLGLTKADIGDRDVFAEIVGLVLKVL